LIGAASDIAIRRWRQTDFQAIRDIAWTTWLASYSSFVPESDLRWFLDEFYSDEMLMRFFNTRNAVTFIAARGSAAVGYAKAYLNENDDKFYIASLYVIPQYQGKGIGGRLMEASEEYARSLGKDEVWLGVMEQNVPALAWYKKLGFQFVHEAPFAMGTTLVNHLIGFRKLSPRK
jgi:ribosomal protein S18 acetylase RimI-like enzyme